MILYAGKGLIINSFLAGNAKEIVRNFFEKIKKCLLPKQQRLCIIFLLPI